VAALAPRARHARRRGAIVEDRDARRDRRGAVGILRPEQADDAQPAGRRQMEAAAVGSDQERVVARRRELLEERADLGQASVPTSKRGASRAANCARTASPAARSVGPPVTTTERPRRASSRASSA
jgi:hypothetical protein